MDSPCYPLVMLIDDNELDTFVTQKLIEAEGFAKEILVFSAAREALAYLKKNAKEDNKIPQVIFLDINMPEMDGFDFLDEFATLEDEIRHKSKVVMLSTSESFEHLNKANQNKYVRKFLNKPLKREALKVLNFMSVLS